MSPNPDGAPPVAAVMPAWNTAALLPRTLPPLLALDGIAEVLVVDPGSTDGTPEVAERLGARVVRLGRRAGPAGARNAGVAAVSAPVVLFVDADCVVHQDAGRRVRDAFAADPGLATLTGSYDADPPDPGWCSQYMNLRHHFTHQRARREDATFWAGCGAVRRDAFLACGGFDEARFPLPMIEDIDLGLRMKSKGATRLDPDLQVTHLKRWTFGSLVSTDIFRRAVPWSRLILDTGSMPDDLNLRFSQRLAALVAPLALLSVAALPVVAVLAPRLVPFCAPLPALAWFLNREMLGFFARRRGMAFGIAGWFLHQLHLSYSAATFALCALGHRLRRRPKALAP